MALMSNFPTGFAQGVTIRGLPVAMTHAGKVWWVYNGTALMESQRGGSDGNRGDFNAPFSTLAQAVSAATATRGDVILIKPGHAETISSATALTLNKAGVAIIGLGYGSARPTFTLDTAGTATVNVTVANVAIKNCIFTANFAGAITACFTTTTAKYFTVEDCLFNEGASGRYFSYIVDTNATSNDTDGLALSGNKWLSVNSSTVSFVKMDGTNQDVAIRDNQITIGGPGTGGGMLMRIATGKVVTNARITGNLSVGATGDAGTNGVLITTDGSTNSGIIDGNRTQHTDTTAEVLVTASSGFSFGLNYSSGVVGSSGYLLPAADS